MANNISIVHDTGQNGNPALRRTIGQAYLLPLFAQMPRCLSGMEACSLAYHIARELRKLGHDVRNIAPRFVRPVPEERQE